MLELSRCIPALSLPKIAIVTQQNSPIVLDALGFEKSAALLQHRESLTSSFYARIARFLSVEVSFAHETSAVQPFKVNAASEYYFLLDIVNIGPPYRDW
jgi:hypothetical protein